MKPENLLFGENFVLKIADFGFATLISGKDGSGMLSTILGTESYMAPEIHLRQPYSGPAVDLFATAIILFILISGTPPFAKADPKNDPHYKLLCVGKHETFWKAHERNKPKEPGQNFYSDEFKDLMNAMLASNPSDRPTYDDIKAHKWYNGQTVSSDDLKVEFDKRKKLVDAELQKQREAKEKQKEMQSRTTYGGNAYGGIKPMRGAQEDMIAEIEKICDGKVDFSLKRETIEYQSQYSNPKTEVMTVFPIDFIFKYLAGEAIKKFADVKFSDDTYKIKATGKVDDGTSTFNIILTTVDENTTCVEFHKKEGNITTFHKLVESMKKDFPIPDNLEEKTE
jgi:serine/threonine protein kinase